MTGGRHEGGYTLIEMLIGALLLAVIATTTYYLLNAMDRGMSLLQGQMEAQQNPRAGMARVISDLQESVFMTVTPSNGTDGSYTPILEIEVVGALCAAATAGSNTVVVDNANGLAPSLPVTIYSGTQAISATSENITLNNAAITSGGSCTDDSTIGNAGGTSYGVPVPYSLTFTTNLKNSYPEGAIIVPSTVGGYTQYFMTASSAGYGVARYVSGTGGTENSSITGFTAPGFWSNVTQNAAQGATSITVKEQNNACPFTIGSYIYINPTSPPAPPVPQVISVSAPLPPNNTNCTLTLSTGIGAAVTAGTSIVRSMPSASTLSSAVTAGQSQITVVNPIVDYCVFNAGDVIVIDPGPNQEVRSINQGCVQGNGATGGSTIYQLMPPQDYQAKKSIVDLASSGTEPLFFSHAAGVTVLRKGTQIGIMSGYQESESGGFEAPSDTYYGEGYGRN